MEIYLFSNKPFRSTFTCNVQMKFHKSFLSKMIFLYLTYFGTRNFLNISCDIDPRGMLHACHTFVNSFFCIMILAYFQKTYNSQKKKKKGILQ